MTTTAADAPVAGTAISRAKQQPADSSAMKPEAQQTSPEAQQAPRQTAHVVTRTLPDAGIVPSNGLPLSNGHLMEAPETGDDDSGSHQEEAAAAPVVAGPQVMPPEVQQAANTADGHAAEPSSNGMHKRVAGPAMPPRELLEAAAEVAAQVHAHPK